MRRREVIALLGAAAVSPFAALAQERVRRVGVLMNYLADDPEAKVYMAAFQQALQERGWSVGRNLQIDHRWYTGDAERFRQSAVELVALAPDVTLVAGVGVLEMQRASRDVPIVLSQAIDPVGAGFVANLARPGGNVTGFMQFEFSLAGKWLQLLKELAPGVTRVGVLRVPGNPAGIGQWAVIQAAAELIGVDLTPIGIHSADEIERGIAAFAREGDGGLIVCVGADTTIHRQTIIANAAKHRMPAIYPHRYMAAGGGLMSYGINLTDQYRRAAGYVDRILRGEKPADLPVQKPTRYELTINMKTAKTLGIAVPPTLLTRADEVIE